MNVLITICARGGSKGIPGKNVKELNGKPLIYYTIETAEKFRGLGYSVDIILSTESAEIKKIVEAGNYSIDTSYTRPEEQATDTAGKLDVIINAMNYSAEKNRKEYDFVIDMDVTSPLRNAKDIQNALVLLQNDAEANNIFSVSPANRNPYFNMVEEDGNGYYKLCKEGKFLTRQSAPKVYDMNASFYIFKKMFFDKNLRTAINDRTLIYEVPHLCFDLDHNIDFEFMSYLLATGKLDFTL